MGDTVLGEVELLGMRLNRDDRHTLSWGGAELFWSYKGPEVHWTKNIKMTGDYRVKIQFTNLDIIRLFRASYGTQLSVDLIEEHGFAISPELEKAILSKIKLTDLTLGDLLAMNAAGKEEPVTADKLASGDNVTPFKRRF